MRRLAWKAAIWLLIASAVVVSLGRLLAPYADVLRPQVERVLSQRLGVPVRIERIEASWPKFSPRLLLHGVRVGPEGQQLLGVNRARVEFRLYNALRPAANVYELIVLGLDVAVIQDADGRWRWRLDRGGRLDEGWLDALAAGDIVLRDAGIRFAPHGLPAAQWVIPEALLRRSGNELGIRLEAQPADGSGERLTGRARIRTDDGRMQGFDAYARVPTLAPRSLLPTPDGAARPVDYLAAGQVWARWDREDGGRGHARLVLRPADGRNGPAPALLTMDGHWAPGELRARFDARRLPRSDAAPVRALVVALDRSGYAIEADRAELAYLHALLGPWLASHARWPAAIAGTVDDLRLHMLDGHVPVAARGTIAGLSLDTAGPEVSVSDLDVALSLAGDEVRLALDGSPAWSIPALFPDRRELRGIVGTLGLRPGALRLDGVELDLAAFAARVDGRILLDDAGPFVDLVVDAPRLSPADPGRWLPRRGLPAQTRGWLNDALLGVEQGRALTTLFGRPARWRERTPPGSVSSAIAFEGLDLAYAREWPVAEDIVGEVRFVGDSMTGTATSGRVAGVPLRAPRVRIRDMRRAEIELTLESPSVDAGRLAGLADALPLAAADAALAAMRFSGPATAGARVWLPVRHRDDWRLLGEVSLDGAAVAFPALDLRLDDLGGVLPFWRGGLGPADLQGVVGDQAVAFALDSRFQPRFRLSLAGRGPVPALLPGQWRRAVPFLADDLAGTTDFDIVFDAAGDPPDAAFGVALTSDLVGVGSSLPAPLDKPADQPVALRLALPLGDSAVPARLRYGDVFDAAWLGSGDYWQAGVALGGGEADLPVAENFIVEGRLQTLAAEAWAGRLAGLVGGGTVEAPAGAGGPNDLSGWLDVSVDEVRVGGGSLGRLEAALNREGDYWRLNALGERLQGSVRIPAGAGAERSLIIDLERLHWPALRQQPAEPAEPSALDPRSVPPFDIAIRSLKRGDLDLGEFRLNSHREADGIAIEQVTSRREGLELNGSGAWRAGDTGPASEMRLRLSARDLGRTLTDAGFDIALERGTAVVEMQGRWPGTPLELSLVRFDGEIELVVSDGAIPAASPGAGRVLGLVSLNSIPRRLRLDFSDVFGQGLAFDRVAGSFRLDDGVAVTDDLRIDAPAAEIRMTGRTDLRDRTYDQTLTVRPGVGSALPIIGALAGGPVGAAAGAALQQIFDEPLKGIGEVRYAVDGSWEDPRIVPVAVEAAEAGG